MLAALLLVSSAACYGFQLPFDFPFFRATGYGQDLSNTTSTPKIAIIGAGVGGTSAAFWISKAKERFGVDVEIDVYERESRIGGRTVSVHPYNNTNLPAIEIGPSTFSSTNKNLWRASQDFNLTRVSVHDSDRSLWDGEKILITLGGSGLWDGGYRNALKFAWRYGVTATKRTHESIETTTNNFSRLYSLEADKWDNVSTLAESLGWANIAAQNMSSYLESRGVSKPFISEIIDATIRLKHGQNVDDIHALQGAFSMASNRYTIHGGISQISEQFLQRSGAKLLLGATVDSIRPKSASHLWTVRSNLGSAHYKAVILAAPFHSAGITLPSTLSSQIPEQHSIRVHVTVLTTTAPSPNSEYFALPDSYHLPTKILTTSEGARNGGKKPEFYSISYHDLGTAGEWAVKIVSNNSLSDEWLLRVFSGQVGWVYRKWGAYPKLTPTSSFPPVKLDQGLYYVHAFEPLISTPEMETVSSRNVVDLLLNEEFESSLCGPRITGSEEQTPVTSLVDEGFVLGWDC